ncbi:MAG: alpha-hydroxy-acid oxidizing protein, partial [Rhodospirillales bacterium]|nr:alpha-hydroxy-acid oxidizing protein [Rhodospirillales bacterium]
TMNETVSEQAKHLFEPTGDFQCLHEFVPAARSKLSDHIWGYLIGATETETTMRRNRLALDSLALRPRVCRDVSHIDLTTTLFHRRLRLPLMLAPVGSLESFHPGGAATAGRAASAFGVPIMVSSVTQPGLEEAAAAADGPKIFQLYVRGDDAWIDEVVRRAVGAGYDAFAITVDTAAYSRRERDIAGRFVKPWRAVATGQSYQASFNWDNVKHFKDTHSIPLILKGIATAEDAALACEHGVDGVYVSNHGGRQLDHGRGSMDVLPEVLAAVRGRARVIVDGGFCRGTDLVKAIALGADAVAIGRLYCYALAADAEAGVVKMLELLEHGIGVATARCGARSLGELNPSDLFRDAPQVGAPHVHSAFPLLFPT